MIRLIIASVLLAIAVFIFFSEVVGFFRFKYVMNRMHAAGLGDTLGIMCAAAAVAVLIGSADAVFKLILIVVFIMLTGPVVTHLIAQTEVSTHKNSGSEYREEDRT